MASYLGHLSFASALGAVYGSVATLQFHLDWGPAFLGAGLTALGGLLPDLDSDSGVPVRELFGLAAIVAPLMILHRLEAIGFSVEQTLVILAGLHLFIRYALSRVFKRFTVHRGIYHSIPALLIAGLAVFLVYESPHVFLRCFLAGGVMLGFLSHLVLDELCSVDFEGAALSLNQFAGSALKLFSQSWPVNLATYTLLAYLGWLALGTYENLPRQRRPYPAPTVTIRPPNTVPPR